MKKHYIFLFLFLILHLPIIVGQPPFNLTHLTTEDGLPSDYITALHEDNYGLLWIGTDKGLARYNGYSYTYFSILGKQSDIHCFHEDKNSNLWIGTGNGLFFYNRLKDL